jgi:heme/copper-type cytochrome/quinol oxidase subunit 4
MRERLALRARIAEGDNDAKPMRNNLQIGFILLMIAAIVAFAMVMSSKI